MKRAEFLMPSTNQCEAKRSVKYADDETSTDKRCSSPAIFRVDDATYCKGHAGIAALAILMKTESAS